MHNDSAREVEKTGRLSQTEGANLFSGAEAEFRRRTPGSSERWQRALRSVPQGVSGSGKFFAPYPLFLTGARGAHAVDVDGNEYIDVLMGNGAGLLGHCHPRVVDAIREQAGRLTGATMPTERGLLLAERIRGHMPYLERLRFTPTGSEATRSALRVARAMTGRLHFAKCEGAYHGSDDSFLVSTHSTRLAGADDRPTPVLDYAGIPPRVLDEVVVLPYNDAAAATALIDAHGGELAAVIVEPLAFSSGGAVPATREFARVLREATRRHGIVLIFDEVVTAYRLGLQGAPAYLGVEPDLATIGKAVGGGMPLAAYGGRAALMDGALAGAAERRIFQSGTFVENAVSIAAGHAVLDVLEEDPGALDGANARGAQLRAGLQTCLEASGLPAAVTGSGSIVHVLLGPTTVANRRDVVRADLEATRRFLLALVACGVLWLPVHPAALSIAHQQADIERVVDAVRRVLARG